MCLIHKWTKWSMPIAVYDNVKQQWKECEKCGKADFRTLPYDKSSSLIDVHKSLNSVNQSIQGEGPS